MRKLKPNTSILGFLIMFPSFKSLGINIIIIFFTPQLFATNIIYTNLTESIFKNNKLQLTIKAQKKVEHIKKDATMLFLNRKKYVAENFYYEHGSVANKEYDIGFKRMFIYGQNIYMTQVQGDFFKYHFRAKKATIYKDRIEFTSLVFASKNQKGSRLKFVYYFAKQNEIK